MSRLVTTGFEVYDVGNFGAGVNTLAPDGRTGTSGGRSGSAARSGSYGIRIVNAGSVTRELRFTGATARSYFARVYVRYSAWPSSSAPNEGNVFWNATDGSWIVFFNVDETGLAILCEPGGSQIGSGSVQLSLDTWHMVEMKVNISAAGNDTVGLRVDGVDVVTDESFALGSSAPGGLWLQNAYAGTFNVDMDDVAINDDQGASQNTWPGGGKVVLLTPISDNQRGSWTGGSGGTTNLYDAVNNDPPAGTATESNTTQIESADSSGDNSTDEYRINLTTYTDAGIGGSDTITLLHPFIDHGEDVATGTKTGSFGMQANPADTYATFTFGDNVGALGTWPTNWRWARGTVTYSPSVTLGSSPVIAVRKTDTGTRVASVDRIGVYAEYVPGVAGADAVMPYAGGGYHPT